MEISPLGHASFRIKGKQANIITDPFDPSMVGLKFPKTQADIVTISHEHQDHNFPSNIEGAEIVLTGPGEYEIKGVSIRGVATYHDDDKGNKRGKNILFYFIVDGIALLHCGDLGHKLSEDQAEAFPVVDILMIPIGGTYTIDAKTACQVVQQLEPKIVIPMHYNHAKLNQQVFGGLLGVTDFLKEMGKEGIEAVPKLTITRERLPQELQVVVLE